ncbi:hypothetical protein [Ruegeria sp.]|uniref:hypothetical protein n=1 Tax=Ruegeria sp. TaxID=1879320 RepID=UPI003B5CD1B2
MFSANSNIKLYSVDVFDTLVFRLAKTPIDVFEGMEYDPDVKKTTKAFRDYRVQAEALARHGASSDGREETSLSEIYECFRLLCRCSAEETNILIQKEIAAEMRAIKLSVFGQEFLEHMKTTGGRFVVTSDMYLPQSVIEDILKNVGVTGYEKLFLSSATQKSKHHGSAYDLVIDHFQTDPSEIMHIGDNWYPDIRMAEMRGLTTYRVTPSNSLMSKVKKPRNNTFAFFGSHPLSQAFSAQYLEAECYSRESAEISDFSDERYFEMIGATVLAPFATAFCLWLADNASKHEIRDLAFLARDGQFVQKVFDILHPNGWNTSYVAASRRMTTLPFTLLRPEVIKNFLHTTLDSSDTISGFFAKLRTSAHIEKHMSTLGFDPDKKLDRRSRRKFLQSLSENSGPLLRSFEQEREIIADYYESAFPPDRKTGLVDLGWRGSLQAAIKDCLGDRSELVGFYVGTSWDAIDILERRGHTHEAFTCMNGMESHQAEMIGRFRDILEFFFSADHGSVYSVAKSGDNYKWLSFDLSDAESSAIETAQFIQKGAIQAIKSLMEKLSYEDIKNLARAYNGEDVWEFLKKPSKQDAARFAKVRVFSGIGDDIGESLTMIGEKNSHHRNVKSSRWPEAYSASLGRFTRMRVNFVRKKKKLPKI